MSYKRLCAKFGVSPDDVKRPRKIYFLISMRNNQLIPTKITRIGKMELYNGPLGKVLAFKQSNKSFSGNVLKVTRTMRAMVQEISLPSYVKIYEVVAKRFGGK